MTTTTPPRPPSLLFVSCLTVGLLTVACAKEVNSPTKSSSVEAVETSENAESQLTLEISPFSDFYFEARAQAGGTSAAQPEFEDIVQAWMSVQEHVGAFGGFWRFDLAGLLAKDPTEFRSWFEDQPESIPNRAGGDIAIQEPGFAMANGMDAFWPQFLEKHWPARSTELESVKSRLQREFMPKHREALKYMLDSLGMENPAVEVPLHLATHTHPPGATTYRTNDGPIAILSVTELLSNDQFSDLEETILHETVHALDLASENDNDALTLLRDELQARLEPGDPRLRGVPHLIMFVQAENTMRRIYNKDHQAYGDSTRGEIAPLYDRHGSDGVSVRKHWTDFLDGAITREQALARIADDVKTH